MPGGTYKVLDLFSGIAGFSLGFRRFEIKGSHPFDVAAYLEIDGNAVNTLVAALKNHGLTEEDAKQRIVHGDITKEETKLELYAKCPQVDIIIGGPPCQSFSLIGPRSGDKTRQEKFRDDERDSLFEHYIRIVTHYKPSFFVFENVTGLLSKRNAAGEKYINVITRRFRKLDYELAYEQPGHDEDYLVLDAADYGVPQHRKRVFIIGNRLGVKNPYPTQTHFDPSSDQSRPKHLTLRDAIGDLPAVKSLLTPTPRERGLRIRDVSDQQRAELRRLNAERYPGTDVQEYHWPAFEATYQLAVKPVQDFLSFVRPQAPDAQLIGHVARGQQQSDIELFRGLGQGMSSKDLVDSTDPTHQHLLGLIKYKMDSFKDKYKKLHWDKPCGTIFAHMQKDGNRFIHPDDSQERTLTFREAARIQSFPDDYPVEAIGHIRYRYIGNAVPPLLGRAIAGALFNVLTEIQVHPE